MSKAKQVDEAFPTTVWERVRKAPEDSEALAELLGTYRGPLVAYLTRKGVSPADAEDAVHQFFVDRVFESGSFLPQADPARGKFRSLLRTSMWRYWIDRVRTQRAGKEAPNRGGPPPVDIPANESERGDGAGEAFEVAVALRLFSQTLRKLRESSATTPGMWGVFEGRVLTLVSGGHPVPYIDLARVHGFKSDKHAANAFKTMHNRFRRLWAEVLAGHFGDQASDEGGDLIGSLRRAGPDLIAMLPEQMWDGLPSVSTAEGCLRIPPEVVAMLHPEGLSSRDPGEALKHLLSTPIWLDSVPAADPSPLSTSSVGDGVVLDNLAILLRHADPGLPLLEGAKDYAKAHRVDPESVYPPEASSVLYYLAISRARILYGASISDLDESRLRTGLQWVVAQAWVDEEWRSLASDAAAKVVNHYDTTK